MTVKQLIKLLRVVERNNLTMADLHLLQAVQDREHVTNADSPEAPTIMRIIRDCPQGRRSSLHNKVSKLVQKSLLKKATTADGDERYKLLALGPRFRKLEEELESV